MGARKQRLSNPLSLPRVCPDVSSLRVTATGRIPRHFFSAPLLSSLFFFFFHLISSIPLLSGFFPPFEILTLVHFLVGDPCSFSPFRSLFFSPYIARYVFLAIHRFSFLLSSLSVAKRNLFDSTPIFIFRLFFYNFSRHSLFPFRSFSSTVLYFSLPCVFLDLLLPIFSFFNDLSRIFYESNLLFSTFSFDFFLSFAFFRIFRIRFSARALYISRSFSRIILSPLSLFFHFFLSPFFFLRPPSLIPLAALPSSIYFDRS